MGCFEFDPFGVFGTKDKEEEEAKERARQEGERQEQAAREEQLRQEQRIEEAAQLSPEEILREQETFRLERERGSFLEDRAGLSGEQLLRQGGPITSKLLDDIAAQQGLTGEQLFTREGALNQATRDAVFNQLQQPRTAIPFDDTLQEQLEIARQMVNAEANKRGVFGGSPEGGIRFEQLGRTGVDLAIKSARERLNFRQAEQQRIFQEQQAAIANALGLSGAFTNLSADAQGRAGVIGEAALQEQAGARGELANFLTNQQNLTSQGTAREFQGVTQGAQIGAPFLQQGLQNRTDINQAILGGEIQQAREARTQGLELLGGFGQLALGGGLPVASIAGAIGESQGTQGGLFDEIALSRQQSPLQRQKSRFGLDTDEPQFNPSTFSFAT